MVLQCPVGVSVLCVVTYPACQSNGQPYNVQILRDVLSLKRVGDWRLRRYPMKIVESERRDGLLRVTQRGSTISPFITLASVYRRAYPIRQICCSSSLGHHYPHRQSR
jgi:hypothetical protein